MLSYPNAIIIQSLNLKSFNLTPEQEAECIAVFKNSGRQVALNHISRLQEEKLYNNSLNTFAAEPNKHQKNQYKKICTEYKIIQASINHDHLITAHAYCPKTNYYFIITISRHQHAAFKGPYKHYDFKAREPHLKILAARPVNKKHKPNKQQLT